MKISISEGNTKLGGRVSNISLPPVVTCRKDAPCARACYARKAYCNYAQTTSKPAWDGNLQFYREDYKGYFEAIAQYLEKPRKRPIEFFRWHISGDIPDPKYFRNMLRIAARFPKVRFLVFTKRYEMVSFSKALPAPNLSIVFSAWPGLDLFNPKGYPVAWMDDGTDSRIPESALHCPGNCSACGACFELAKTGRDVVFKKH
jgi:hypothetical protein